MDLRRLEYFLAVIEHGQVTSAAAALHLTQPSLSQAIRNLERDLGVELFRRDGRGLTPTAAGLALVEPARRVMGGLDVARSAVEGVVELSSGWLDVAAPDLLGRDPMATALATFHRRHPRVPVRIHEPRDEDEMIRLLEGGGCELALTYLQPGPPPNPVGLTIHPLGHQEVWVVLPPGQPVSENPLPLTDITGMSVIDATRGFAPSRIVRAALHDAGVRLRPTVRNGHREAVIPLVLAGAGMAFTSAAYAMQAALAGAVTRQLCPAITLPYAVIHRTGGLSPAAKSFFAVLCELATRTTA